MTCQQSTLRQLLLLPMMAWLLQSAVAQGQLTATAPLPLDVGYGKTVSISFPCAIKSVDRGSAELLAQKASGTENVLLLKTAQKGMEPTSLMVITCQGSLYSFWVSYQENPSEISLQLQAKSIGPAPAVLSGLDSQDTAFALLGNQKPNLKGIRGTNQQIRFSAQGIYIKAATLYLAVSIENRSMLDYQIENLGLFVREVKQAKRTAIQQQQIGSLIIGPDADTIASGQKRTMMVAFPKLTLTKNKRLFIELTEQNGARSIRLRLKAKHLRRVRPI